MYKTQHKIKVGVTKKNRVQGGIVRCRRVSVRERILRFFFGDLRQMTIIVPGDTVRDVTIQEVKHDDA